MPRNKIIAGGLIFLGVVLIFIIGGLQLSRSGKMNNVSILPGGRSGIGMMPDYPASDLGFRAPESASEAATSQKMMASDEVIASETVSVEKKMIKNGSLDLRVDRVDEATQEIARIAQANGGEIFASNVYINPANKIKSGSVTVKVPVANFQKTFEELKKSASLVVSESTSGQDVSEDYADLQARLKNKQAEEVSIAKILERAGSIEDVLKVTRELNRVRGEIERLQAQMKMMDSQTDKATIFVSMTEDQDVTVVDSWRPWQLAKDSMNRLVKGLQGFVNFVIVLLISVLPILILYFVLVYVLYRIGKRVYLRYQQRKTQNQ